MTPGKPRDTKVRCPECGHANCHHTQLVDLGLNEVFLNFVLDEAEKRYDNKLQKQPFVFGAAVAVGYYSREIAAYESLLKEAEALREALAMQHQWQQDIGVVKLMPGDHELNLSLEYSDSTMCEKTCEALARFDAWKEKNK